VKSALGRGFDVGLSSNRYVIAATWVAGAAGFFTSLGDGFGNAIGDGFVSGGATFLAWAIARELDPDSTLTAAIAAPIGLGIWFIGAPGLWVVGTALLAMRLIANTTGRSPWPADLVVAIGFAAVAGLRPGGVIAASALGVALILDCLLSPKARTVQYAAGLFAVIAGAIAAVVWADLLAFETVSAIGGLIAVLSLLAVAATPLRNPLSVGDLTGKPLSRKRIRLARGAAVVIGAGYLVFGGETGLITIGPMLAAMIALPLGLVQNRAAAEASVNPSSGPSSG